MSRRFARLKLQTCELTIAVRSPRILIPNQSRLASTSKLPRIAQPSLWQSIVPRSLRDGRREPQDAKAVEEKQPRKWNPATTIFMLAILVGSQAIHLINVKNDTVNFSRKTDAKIALLREVISRVQAGEEVDVEKVLGTGDPKSEAEWKQVMKELESDDHLWQEKQWKVKRREKKAAAAAAAAAGAGDQTEDQESRFTNINNTSSQQHERPRFY